MIIMHGRKKKSLNQSGLLACSKVHTVKFAPLLLTGITSPKIIKVLLINRSPSADQSSIKGDASRPT